MASYTVQQRKDKGFDFFKDGQKISVDQYVQGTGTDKQQLVQGFANQGDAVSQKFVASRPQTSLQPFNTLTGQAKAVQNPLMNQPKFSQTQALKKQPSFFEGLLGLANDTGKNIGNVAKSSVESVADGIKTTGEIINQVGGINDRKIDLINQQSKQNAADLQSGKISKQDFQNKSDAINNQFKQNSQNLATQNIRTKDRAQVAGDVAGTFLNVATIPFGGSFAAQGFKQGVKAAIPLLAKDAGQLGTIGAATGANEVARDKGLKATPTDYLKGAATGAVVGAGTGVAIPVVASVAGSATRALAKGVQESLPKNIAASHPSVTAFDNDYSQLTDALKNTQDPAQRSQLTQSLTQNRILKARQARQVEQEVGQGGYIGKGEEPTNLNESQQSPLQDRSMPEAQSLETGTNRTSEQMTVPSPAIVDNAPSIGQQFETATKTSTTMPQTSQPRTINQSLTTPQERGFVETIINDPNTDAHIKETLSSLYTVRNTKELQTKAANLVRDNPDLAKQVVNAGNGDISVATGSELLKRLQKEGNYEDAISFADTLAKQLTEAGRTAQAASIYGKLTPEGILRFAQKEIGKYNQSNNLLGANKLKLTAEQAQSLSTKSAAIQKMAEGRAKDVATKELMNEVYSLLPAGWVQKVSTLQTMAQLFNPKTTIRNVLGNGLFGGLDNVSTLGAAGIDKMLSALKGTDRTIAIPNLKTQFKGAVKGGKEAYEEVTKGINLGPATQFELADIPTFRSGILGNLEKTMGVTLRVPDRAAYQAAFDDTVQGLMKANGLTEPTQEILELANANGLYKTFQDNSKAAQLFSHLKQALNHVGVEKNGKSFGLGDLILKYPKTPGNILSRGLDYSPVGILKAISEIAKPAITKQPFNQNAFSMALSRGIVGTGAIGGAGAVLGALGIITEKPSEDKDTRDLQKASGLGGYQINTDALRRFVLSGFDKSQTGIQIGDTLVSYDWAQPLSIPLSAGAALGKGDDAASSTLDSALGGFNTLIEQPLVTGVSTFAGNIKNKGLIGSLGEAAKGAPASFIPTALNQVRQLTDNTTRTADSALDKVINRIPGASTTLPEQRDPLGDTKQNYQNGSNNPLNVLFNPAFVTKYMPQDQAQYVLDIMNRSGESKQIPHSVDATQTINGESLKLNGQQKADYQKYVGERSKSLIDALSKDAEFNTLGDAEKASRISNALSDINSAAKIELFGNQPKTISKDVKSVLNGGNPAVSNQVDTSTTSTDPQDKYKAKVAKYEQDVKDGKLSGPKQLATKQALDKEAITSTYSQDVLDFYQLSKAQQDAFFNQDRDKATSLYNKAKELDGKLVSQGLGTTKFSTRSRSTSSSTRSSGGRKTSAKKGSRRVGFKAPSKGSFSRLQSTSAIRKLLASAGGNIGKRRTS